MLRLIAVTAAALAAGVLCACSANTSAALDSTLNMLSQNYAHCHHTLTYAAAVGGLNPASGINIQGSIDCPPVGPNGEPLNTSTTTSTAQALSTTTPTNSAIASNAVTAP